MDKQLPSIICRNSEHFDTWDERIGGNWNNFVFLCWGGGGGGLIRNIMLFIDGKITETVAERDYSI